MQERRSVSGGTRKKKADDNHGATEIAEIGVTEKSVRVRLTFNQAMKLSVAIQDCVLALHRNDQRSGKEWGMLLTFWPDDKWLTVTERQIRAEKTK